jgi:uncharacterized membrane protein
MIEIIPNWHPIFVHFTVALLVISVFLFVVAQLIGKRPLQKQCLIVARWNLWIGTGFALITVLAGWLASNGVAHDTISHAVMEKHRNLAFATFANLLLLAGWAWWTQHKSKEIGILFIGFALLLLGLLTSTAWQGSELVYRYGVGVMSMPNAVNHGHTNDEHVHADEADMAESHQPAKNTKDVPSSIAVERDEPTKIEHDAHKDDGHNH